MPAPLRWLKLWFDLLDDPKTGTLPDATFRLWIGVLILAGENRMLGWFPRENIAWRLRLPEPEVTAHLEKLIAAGVVSEQAGRVAITQWTSRQGGIARTAKSREARSAYIKRKRGGVTPGVTTEGEGEGEEEGDRRGRKERKRKKKNTQINTRALGTREYIYRGKYHSRKFNRVRYDQIK